MISEAAKLYKHLLTIDKSEVPIIVPVFDLVTYAKFMVSQLLDYGLENFIICDNNSTYPPMIEYLDELSKTQRVVRFDENLGPRVFAERPDFLSIMPEYFIITDPDIKFNKNLPKNFIEKMKTIIETYGVSKCGFAVDVWSDEACSKFYKRKEILSGEFSLWSKKINNEYEKDDLYVAQIDTTFCLYNSEKIKNEINSAGMLCNTSSIRIAGRFLCEHMGYWEKQPITHEEEEYYKDSNIWSATVHIKKYGDNVIYQKTIESLYSNKDKDKKW